MKKFKEEEEDFLTRIFHSMVMSVNMHQVIRWATNREVGGFILLGDVCMKTRQQVADVLRDKHPDIRLPPMEKLHVRGL